MNIAISNVNTTTLYCEYLSSFCSSLANRSNRATFSRWMVELCGRIQSYFKEIKIKQTRLKLSNFLLRLLIASQFYLQIKVAPTNASRVPTQPVSKMSRSSSPLLEYASPFHLTPSPTSPLDLRTMQKIQYQE